MVKQKVISRSSAPFFSSSNASIWLRIAAKCSCSVSDAEACVWMAAEGWCVNKVEIFIADVLAEPPLRRQTKRRAHHSHRESGAPGRERLRCQCLRPKVEDSLPSGRPAPLRVREVCQRCT